eukprot:TRINITY_DN20203_c1_g2_i1.p1 TRINITY_DN20203_c1_g2~~TRINITY_DN20203_c1_g2_i1.p1  ORF type:complete len:644 (+),score=215.92 TRINITY_DN20203_c1_g2_i1:52-1983(+)
MRSALLLGGLAVAGVDASNYAMNSYQPGSGALNVLVNSLTSTDGIIPFDFYSLKFCKPNQEDRYDEDLGEVMWGDRIEPSLYNLTMMRNETCVPVVCPDAEQQKLTAGDLSLFQQRINAGYRGNLVLDNLPVVTDHTDAMEERLCPTGRFFDPQIRGYPLGVPSVCVNESNTENGVAQIHNHLAFTVQVNQWKTGSKGYFVVGFYVEPRSIAFDSVSSCGPLFDPIDYPALDTSPPPKGQTKSVVWSYSVKWVRKNVVWASRWDAYLNSSASSKKSRVHWMNIINSLLVVVCLCGVVAMIVMRTLHLDFNRYNNPENQDEMQEEVGWKLVHADVFRAPRRLQTFIVIVATGVQLLIVFVVTLIFALFGFLAPRFRGALLTTLLLLQLPASVFNGQVVAMLQMMFSAKTWKAVFASALVFPGMAFGLWMIGEIALRTGTKGASDVVPLSTIASIIALWFGVSVPCVVLGASVGYKRTPIEHPVKVRALARHVPPQPFWVSTPFLLVVASVVPFSGAYIELKFILGSIWQGLVYYVFGFLALVLVITMLTLSLTTVVAVYHTLVHEDYRWWWQSVTVAMGMGLHSFLYSWYYYATTLHVKSWLATFLFFEFTLVVATVIALVCSAVGFGSAWLFVRTIYTSIKVE